MVDLEKDGDILEITEDASVIEHIDNIQEERQALLKKQANKIIRKNRREIKRIRKHAENCLFDNNKEGYIYSIGKLRKLTGNVVSTPILESLWKTSREEIIKIASSFQSARDGLK
jgi:ribosome recycling factor